MSSTNDIKKLRERLKKRHKERMNLGIGADSSTSSTPPPTTTPDGSKLYADSQEEDNKDDVSRVFNDEEKTVLERLYVSKFPLQLSSLHGTLSEICKTDVAVQDIENMVKRFEQDELLQIEKESTEAKDNVTILSIKKSKISLLLNFPKDETASKSLKRKREDSPSKDEDAPPAKCQVTSAKYKIKTEDNSIESLLSSTTFKEQESKEMGQELFDLLNVPTAKEQSLAEKFKSEEGTVREFCQQGTRGECRKVNNTCAKLHFKRIIKEHTDESLGDCSFLNTCFHMDTCKYVHYEVESSTSLDGKISSAEIPAKITLRSDSKVTMLPPQWIQCDIRYLDNSVLGKYAVIMADPPWDIHMELPYGTMQDDEMRKLDVPSMQDEGFLFLWVTGRAMELGRECLRLWGYKQVEELIWVKTNQLQRLIRTGRTGHWLNHGKEHCLVGLKGNPEGYNKGLDCDVIVAEVRQTSHKPDEIYGLIERLSPGTRKIEFFGRMHNIQPNWVTLGNQLDGVHLVEPELIKNFKEKYPDMNALKPPEK